MLYHSWGISKKRQHCTDQGPASVAEEEHDGLPKSTHVLALLQPLIELKLQLEL